MSLTNEEITSYIQTLLETHRRWNEVVCLNVQQYIEKIILSISLNGDELPPIVKVHEFMVAERRWVGGAVAFTTTFIHQEAFMKEHGEVLMRAVNRFSRRFKIVYLVEPMARIACVFANREIYGKDLQVFLEMTQGQTLQVMYHERRHLMQDWWPDMQLMGKPSSYRNMYQEADALAWSVIHYKHLYPTLHHKRGRKNVL